MSCFSNLSTATTAAHADSTKRVNYALGMILGVDDFVQEFAYQAGRDRWLARDLLGCGTIRGLKIRLEKDQEKGWRVAIEPGAATTPGGQLVCVPTAQCAYLDSWLAANAKDLIGKVSESVESPISSPPFAQTEVRLFVTLGYAECLTDTVPIPGEPCRSEPNLTAPSRVKDDFRLELRFAPPAQSEENRVRDFARWLRRVPISDSIAASTPLADFLDAIRAAARTPFASPPETNFMAEAPPADLRIHQSDVCDYLRAAFLVWTTELRPIWLERGGGCAEQKTIDEKNADDSVLLAELRVPLEAASPSWKVAENQSIEIIEDCRPLVVHLRMLQEWLLCQPVAASNAVVSPPIFSPPIVAPVNLKLDDLSDVNVAAPATGQALIFRDGEWVAELLGGSGGATAHAALSGLETDDHKQYLLVDGNRALAGNLDAGGNSIRNLTAAAANGEAVVFEQAIKRNDAAGGDLSGAFPAPTVSRLQNNPVSPAAPNAGDALIWNGAAWQPQAAPRGSVRKLPLMLAPAIVTRTKDLLYEIWFTIDAPDNLAEVVVFKENNLRIFDETATANFLDAVDFDLQPFARNVFVVRLRSRTQIEPDRMRFDFDLRGIGVARDGERFSLLEYAEKNNIEFLGSKENRTATVFVRGSGARG